MLHAQPGAQEAEAQQPEIEPNEHEKLKQKRMEDVGLEAAPRKPARIRQLPRKLHDFQMNDLSEDEKTTGKPRPRRPRSKLVAGVAEMVPEAVEIGEQAEKGQEMVEQQPEDKDPQNPDDHAEVPVAEHDADIEGQRKPPKRRKYPLEQRKFRRAKPGPKPKPRPQVVVEIQKFQRAGNEQVSMAPGQPEDVQQLQEGKRSHAEEVPLATRAESNEQLRGVLEAPTPGAFPQKKVIRKRTLKPANYPRKKKLKLSEVEPQIQHEADETVAAEQAQQVQIQGDGQGLTTRSGKICKVLSPLCRKYGPRKGRRNPKPGFQAKPLRAILPRKAKEEVGLATPTTSEMTSTRIKLGRGKYQRKKKLLTEIAGIDKFQPAGEAEQVQAEGETVDQHMHKQPPSSGDRGDIEEMVRAHVAKLVDAAGARPNDPSQIDMDALLDECVRHCRARLQKMMREDQPRDLVEVPETAAAHPATDDVELADEEADPNIDQHPVVDATEELEEPELAKLSQSQASQPEPENEEQSDADELAVVKACLDVINQICGVNTDGADGTKMDFDGLVLVEVPRCQAGQEGQPMATDPNMNAEENENESHNFAEVAKIDEVLEADKASCDVNGNDGIVEQEETAHVPVLNAEDADPPVQHLSAFPLGYDHDYCRRQDEPVAAPESQETQLLSKNAEQLDGDDQPADDDCVDMRDLVEVVTAATVDDEKTAARNEHARLEEPLSKAGQEVQEPSMDLNMNTEENETERNDVNAFAKIDEAFEADKASCDMNGNGTFEQVEIDNAPVSNSPLSDFCEVADVAGPHVRILSEEPEFEMVDEVQADEEVQTDDSTHSMNTEIPIVAAIENEDRQVLLQQLQQQPQRQVHPLPPFWDAPWLYLNPEQLLALNVALLNNMPADQRDTLLNWYGAAGYL
ncbi:unnamed protein product, partial [Mesorhabditis spiculigera]